MDDDYIERKAVEGYSIPRTCSAPLTDHCYQEWSSSSRNQAILNLFYHVLKISKDDMRYFPCSIEKLTPEKYPLFFYKTQHSLVLKVMNRADRAAMEVLEMCCVESICGPDAIKSAKAPIKSGYELEESLAVLDEYETLLELTSKEWKGRSHRFPITVSHPTIAKLKLISSTSGLWILERGDNVVLLTADHFAMLCDVVRQRAMMYLSYNCGALGTTAMSTMRRTIEWQESVLLTYGNSGFDLVKSPEALGKAVMIRLADAIIPGHDPMIDMVEKYKSKEANLTNPKGLIKEIVSIADSITDMDTAFSFFSLAKFCGYPMINVKESSRTMKDLGQDKGEFDPKGLDDLVNTVKFMILEAQLKKGSWPPFIVPPEKGTRLHDFYLARSLSLKYVDCPLSDFRKVIFDKIYSCDHSQDGLELFDDKTIAGYDSTVLKSFGRAIQGSDSTRLIEATLRGGEVDLDLAYKNLREGTIPKEQMVTTLTFKGGELKPIGRGFAMFSKEIRALLSDMERSLADGLMKDLPYQTMTLGKKEVSDRLSGLTSNAKALSAEMDLSRWNLRWKGRVVNPVGRVLDQIYGRRNCWSRLHQLFSEVTVLVRMPGCFPDGFKREMKASQLPESDLCWSNHLGGFEGQAQKLWTICTSAMMLMATKGMDCSITLTGQGDNQIEQILRGYVDTRSDTDFMNEYLDRKSRVCSSVGHELKPEECIISKGNIVTYSKLIYWDGSQYHPALKSLAKVLNPSSDDLLSFSIRYSGVTASISAAAEAVSNPFICIRMAVIIHFLLLERESNLNVFGLSQQVRTLLPRFSEFWMIPAALGGLSNLNPVALLYKGYTDPTGLSVSALFKLGGEKGAKYISKILREAPDPQLARLIEDPYSLPLTRQGGNVTTIFKRDTELLVRSWSGVTTEIGRAIMEGNTTYRDQVSECLASVRPLFPLVAHALLEKSVPGVADSLVSRLKSTKTIVRASTTTNQTPPHLRLEKADQDILSYLIDGLDTAHTYGKPGYRTCFDLVEALRRKWGVDDNGVPIAMGLTTLCIYDCLVDSKLGANMMFYAREPRVLQALPVTRRPYRGPGTGQKRAYGGISVAVDSAALRDIRELALILSQLKPGKNYGDFVKRLIESRTTIPCEVITSLLPTVVGGTVEHRQDIMGKAAFDLGVMGREVSMTRISADLVQTRGRDFPIAFQEFFCFGVSANAVQIKYGNHTIVQSLGLNVDLSSLPEIEEVQPDMKLSMAFPPAKQNRILTAEIRTLIDFRTNLVTGSFEPITVDDISSFSDLEEAVCGKLSTILYLPSVISSLDQRSLPRGMATQILDWSEYERLGHRIVIGAAALCAARLGNMCAFTAGEGRLHGRRLEESVEDISHVLAKAVSSHSQRLQQDKWLIERGVNYSTGEGSYNVYTTRLAGLIGKYAINLIQNRKASLLRRVILPASEAPPVFQYWKVSVALGLLFDNREHDDPQVVTACRVIWKNLTLVGEGAETSYLAVAGKAASLMSKPVLKLYLIAILGGEVIYRVLDQSATGMTRFLRRTHKRWESVDGVRYGGLDQQTMNKKNNASIHSLGLSGGLRLQAPDASPSPPKEELARLTFSKHLAMRGGMTTGAGAAWSCTRLPKESSGNRVLVVGAGNGAIMALVSSCGGYPIGTDLISNIPDEGDIASYTPPEMGASGLKGELDFRSVINGGNWHLQSQSTLERVKPDIVVIDIESGIVTPLITLAALGNFTGTVYFRFFGHIDFASSLVSALGHSDCMIWRIFGPDSTGSETFILRWVSRGIMDWDNLQCIPSDVVIGDQICNQFPLRSNGHVILSSAMATVMPRSLGFSSTSIEDNLKALDRRITAPRSSVRPVDVGMIMTCKHSYGMLHLVHGLLYGYSKGDLDDAIEDLWAQVGTHLELSNGDFAPITQRSFKIACKVAGRLIAGAKNVNMGTVEIISGIDLT